MNVSAPVRHYVDPTNPLCCIVPQENKITTSADTVSYEELEEKLVSPVQNILKELFPEKPAHLIASYYSQEDVNLFWMLPETSITELMGTTKNILDLSSYQSLTSIELLWIKTISPPSSKIVLKFPTNYQKKSPIDMDELTAIFQNSTLTPFMGEIDQPALEKLEKIANALLRIQENVANILKDPILKEQYDRLYLSTFLDQPIEAEACLMALCVYFKEEILKLPYEIDCKDSHYQILFEKTKCDRPTTTICQFDDALSIAIKLYLVKERVLPTFIKNLMTSNQWHYIGQIISDYFLATPEERKRWAERPHKKEIINELQRAQERIKKLTKMSFNDLYGPKKKKNMAK